MGDVHDVITCAKFQIEIFMSYDFTGRQIFDFPIDFSMGLTTVQRYCTACDHTNKLELYRYEPSSKIPHVWATIYICCMYVSIVVMWSMN